MPICPKGGCGRELPSDQELYRHLRDKHNLSADAVKAQFPHLVGQGWYEEQRPVVTKNGVEDKAVEHQIASLKAKMQDTLTAPIVPPPAKKPEPSLSPGWKRMQDGYIFERTIASTQTPFDVSKKVLRAKVTGNHGTAHLYTYTKDLREVAKLQDKASELGSRLQRHVVSDPAYHGIAEELYNTQKRIEELEGDVKPDEYVERVLEDYYHLDQGSEKHSEWQSEFMKKTVAEAERLADFEKKKED